MKQVVSTMLLAMLALSAHAVPMRKVDVTLKGPKGEVEVIKAEVADTDAARQHGLMNRTKMAANEGMIFIWPKPEKVGFWMKNTPLPLDMLFISKGNIVAVAPSTKPMDETVISPPEPVDMVLEVNAGWAAAHKLGPGWTLTVGK